MYVIEAGPLAYLQFSFQREERLVCYFRYWTFFCYQTHLQYNIINIISRDTRNPLSRLHTSTRPEHNTQALSPRNPSRSTHQTHNSQHHNTQKQTKPCHPAASPPQALSKNFAPSSQPPAHQKTQPPTPNHPSPTPRQHPHPPQPPQH